MMGEFSKIEWTTHTFNPWWGCTKVVGDPACHNCYAESFSKRVGQKVWGKSKPRRLMSNDRWKVPEKWDRMAAAAGERHRVFCASMADVFEEDRPDLDEHRERLWSLIDRTPNLDWLLLTKRPENIGSMLGTSQRDNVWLGATVVTQEWAGRRIPLLMREAAAVRFLSMEPLLGDVYLGLDDQRHLGQDGRMVDWVIVGGESGPKSRPFTLESARSLRDQCAVAGVPFFMKQLGRVAHLGGERLSLMHGKGGDIEEWPEDLRVRQFPQAPTQGGLPL